MPTRADQPHLVLAAIEDGCRALTIRVLGAYAESIGVRTTLLVIIKKLATIGHPVTFSRTELARLLRFLRRNHVTHLGFYLMTASLKPYRLLVHALRNAGYDGVILAGGVHVALCPEESLVDGADFAVQGPGELPLKMIFDGAAPATIPGLVWRNNGRIQVNPQSPDQRIDLDSLPFPIFRFDRDKVLLNSRLRTYTWRVHRRYADWHGKYYDLITSRGCPYRCSYCCRVDRGAIRRASVDRVIRELVHLRQHHPQVKGVNIQDDAFFSGSPEWVEEFCRRMKADVGLPFIIRMIPRFVTRERVRLFQDAGLVYVTMGLEGSDRLNRGLYQRAESRDSFLRAAHLILQARLYLSIDVLIDNPYETEDDLREVALTLNSLPRPDWGVVVLPLTPFPNTPLYERCLKDGALQRFATDPYDAMLMPSREGAYRTPHFWRLLYTDVLPATSREFGERIIAAGPNDPQAVRTVERTVAMMRRTRRMTAWLRDTAPWLYRSTTRLLRRLTRGRTQPRGMKGLDD